MRHGRDLWRLQLAVGGLLAAVGSLAACGGGRGLPSPGAAGDSGGAPGAPGATAGAAGGAGGIGIDCQAPQEPIYSSLLIGCLGCPTETPDPTRPFCCAGDCCTTCGIDQLGTKTCRCVNGAYAACACVPPSSFPVGLTGGPCLPQGDSRTQPPAGAVSLRGMPCTRVNTVCFTVDSLSSSPRGCLCGSDFTLHCGAVYDWFTNNGVPTPY